MLACKVTITKEKGEGMGGEKMKEKLRCMVAIIAILMLSAIVAPVFACTNVCTRQTPNVDLTGVWSFNDNGYMHTMIISSFNRCTGAFSGTGYYNADPTISWTITGTESGNTISINYVLTVTGTTATGVTLIGTGTLTSSTYMSGTGSQSNVGAVTWSATKATLVVNVSWMVINDEDYRWGSGCWALDNGMMAVQVWQLPDGSYVGIKTYNEMFYTPKGALSPVVGTVEPKNGYGTMDAQYIVSFAGTLATGVKLTGCLGVKNYGGTVADVLLGAAAQGALSGYSWRGQYFSGATNVVYHSDSWTYKLCDDRTATARNLVETNAYQTLYYNPIILATPTAVGDIVT